MEEIKTKAIILNTQDFGDADKLANAFSLEYGRITIKFVGVKKQKAKLKPLVQPFTFVELECFRRGDFFTAKTGIVIDSFPKITSEYQKTICAYILMDIVGKILPKNKVESRLFLSLSNALDGIENNPYVPTIQFILDFFDVLGENLVVDLKSNHIYLDLDMGNFSSERTPNSIEIDKKCYSVLSNLNENVSDSLYKMTLKMLNNIFRAKFDVELNSFAFL